MSTFDDNSARRFAYRVCFDLPARSGLEHSSSEVRVESLPGHHGLLLSGRGGHPISETREFALEAHGFLTEEAAEQRAWRLRDALALAGVRMRIGIDVGPGRAERRLPDSLSTLGCDRHGLRPVGDDPGVWVFEELPNLAFLGDGGSATYQMSLEPFLDALRASIRADPQLNDKQRLAVDLYGLSHFDSSPRTRLVSLATVVEALASPAEAPDQVQRWLKGAIDLAKNDRELRSWGLADSLRNLKRQSISRACQEVVDQHLGSDSAATFKRHYKLRCDLVHTGRVEDVDLTTEVREFDRLVSDLLLAVTTRSDSSLE